MSWVVLYQWIVRQINRTADTIIISISLINIRTTQTNTTTFMEEQIDIQPLYLVQMTNGRKCRYNYFFVEIFLVELESFRLESNFHKLFTLQNNFILKRKVVQRKIFSLETFFLILVKDHCERSVVVYVLNVCP